MINTAKPDKNKLIKSDDPVRINKINKLSKTDNPVKKSNLIGSDNTGKISKLIKSDDTVKKSKLIRSESDGDIPMEKIPFDVGIIIDMNENEVSPDKRSKGYNENNINKSLETEKKNVSFNNNELSGNSKQNLRDQYNKDLYIQENLSLPWNMRIMLQLKKIGEKSIGYKWMHDKEMNNCEKSKMLLTSMEIVLLAVLAAITSGEFISLVSQSGIQNSFGALVGISVSQIVIIFLCTLVKGFKDLGEYERLIFAHRFSKLKFDELYYSIEQQFSRTISKRSDGDSFLEAKTREFTDLMFNSPIISRDVLNSYMKATNKDDIYKPILVGQFDTIEIIIDKNDNNNINMAPKKEEDDINNSNYNMTNEKLKFQIDRWLNNN